MVEEWRGGGFRDRLRSCPRLPSFSNGGVPSFVEITLWAIATLDLHSGLQLYISDHYGDHRGPYAKWWCYTRMGNVEVVCRVSRVHSEAIGIRSASTSRVSRVLLE
jgi:hypothetical protein